MPSITAVSEQALLVRFAEEPTPAVAVRIQAVVRALDAARPAWLVDCVPAFCSLLLIFDPLREDAAVVGETVRRALAAAPDTPALARRLVVPVWYDPEVAPDLEGVARECALTVDEVVARHCGRNYLVYALGFKPGFPYMASLDDALVVPRLATPRPAVPPGSVAIAGRQTGIYTVRSPGGWRIIGRTPWRVFDPGGANPFRIRAGDEVRFQAIGRARFMELERAEREGE